MMKKLAVLFTASFIFLMFGNNAVEANGRYGYGTSLINNFNAVSSYTFATNDHCSASVRGTYLLNDGFSTRGHSNGGDRDPNTGHATARLTKPSGSRYYTRADGTHYVGRNRYTTRQIK